MRLKYQFYRTPIGHLLYYLFEIWRSKLFWPKGVSIGGYRSVYLCDLILVTLWLFGWPLVLLSLKAYISHPIIDVPGAVFCIFLGVFLPFLVFNALMSAVIFLHHTHPSVEWYGADDPIDPEECQRRSSVHILFPGQVNWIFHRIMEHTAHHLRPGIPLYNLLDGQTTVESKSGDVLVQKWNIAFHRETLSRCKLFDLDRRCWTDYYPGT